MEKRVSRDGTKIAYDRSGSGPALVLVTGAFCDRATGAPIAEAMSDRFTVYRFDRRGRGDSGDTPPWEVAREVEDLAAVAEATGEAPLLYGHSSGGALVLEAAAAGVPARRVVVYEPPYAPGEGTLPETADRLAALCRDDRPGEAAALFLRSTGMPDQQLTDMRSAPFWSQMVALAPQLEYDVRLANGGSPPVQKLTGIDCPTLALAGGLSAPWAPAAAEAIAHAVPHGESRILEGQRHAVEHTVVVAILDEFFATHKPDRKSG
jgi:pimeloyl-ACP methyl ester carboxylesterase